MASHIVAWRWDVMNSLLLSCAFGLDVHVITARPALGYRWPTVRHAGSNRRFDPLVGVYLAVVWDFDACTRATCTRMS